MTTRAADSFETISTRMEEIRAINRHRLPNRRATFTEAIHFVWPSGAVAAYEATVGFDRNGDPKEIFLFGAKDGTDMASTLADIAVALSVALQHGVTAESMAVSVSRDEGGRPATLIGAALDLLTPFEREDWRAAAAAGPSPQELPVSDADEGPPPHSSPVGAAGNLSGAGSPPPRLEPAPRLFSGGEVGR